MKVIDQGVCAAKGFLAGACHCGIRKNQSKDDLALIYSQSLCQSARGQDQGLQARSVLIQCQGWPLRGVRRQWLQVYRDEFSARRAGALRSMPWQAL